jgi:hypothetical protein
MTPSVKFAGGRRVTRWTCESIITKIAEWNARHGEPPCSADWNPSLARWRAQEWRVERYYDGQWPSTNAVKRAFGGSFDAAVRAAGLEPARPGPRRAAGAARPAVPQRAPLPPRAAVAGAAEAGGVEPAVVALADAEARASLLERRLAAAEDRAERAEGRLREARKRARLANDRASRAKRTRDRALDEADARVRAALDQAEAAVRDAEALRRTTATGTTGDGPAGPAPLGLALRSLASARATGDRQGLRRALGEVAASALRWRDRL